MVHMTAITIRLERKLIILVIFIPFVKTSTNIKNILVMVNDCRNRYKTFYQIFLKSKP
jgi:hypothetical protein